jgi:hypothetical protein
VSSVRYELSFYIPEDDILHISFITKTPYSTKQNLLSPNWKFCYKQNVVHFNKKHSSVGRKILSSYVDLHYFNRISSCFLNLPSYLHDYSTLLRWHLLFVHVFRVTSAPLMSLTASIPCGGCEVSLSDYMHDPPVVLVTTRQRPLSMRCGTSPVTATPCTTIPFHKDVL